MTPLILKLYITGKFYGEIKNQMSYNQKYEKHQTLAKGEKYRPTEKESA